MHYTMHTVYYQSTQVPLKVGVGIVIRPSQGIHIKVINRE